MRTQIRIPGHHNSIDQRAQLFARAQGYRAVKRPRDERDPEARARRRGIPWGGGVFGMVLCGLVFGGACRG